jgi:hypothetical protein
MFRSTKQLYGDKLAALDGELGTVKDFYFDDQVWSVRYVVVETGKWLTSRQVLLSPRAFGDQYPNGKTIPVKLTRKQIEASPTLEWHKPVSRQFEDAYHRHYGWPSYWLSEVLSTTSGFPLVKPPAQAELNGLGPAVAPDAEAADAHLHSMQAVRGYHLHATDGTIGHITDFLMDDATWTVRQLIVKTGHRITGREVQVPTGKVDRISYKESTVFVNMLGEAVEQCPAYQPAAPIPKGKTVSSIVHSEKESALLRDGRKPTGEHF